MSSVDGKDQGASTLLAAATAWTTSKQLTVPHKSWRTFGKDSTHYKDSNTLLLWYLATKKKDPPGRGCISLIF